MRAVLAQIASTPRLLPTLILAGLLIVPHVSAAAQAPPVQRYRQALAALAAGDMTRYRQLAATLQDYILRPYLRYAYLQATLQSARPETIDAFLRRNADLPIAAELHRAWLLELARREDWKRFLADDERRFGGTRIACARTQALTATGRDTAAVALARRLWRVGYSQPGSCDAAFDLLRDDGRIPAPLVRERLVLALRAGNLGLARYLSTLLPSSEQATAARWLHVYAEPRELRELDLDELGGPRTGARVAAAALGHLARRQPAKAHALWAELAPRLQSLFDERERLRLVRTIAVSAAIDGLPQSENWLAALPAAASDRTSREWRARAALRNGDWAGLLAAIRAMPEAQRRLAAWRYWEARALLRTGEIGAARKLAAPLAREFSYYGFLAADLVQRPYAHGPQPTQPDPDRQKRVAGMRLTRIALALHQADQPGEAGAAWRALLRRLTPRERLAAAWLAHRRDWAYGAYVAAAQSPGSGASALTFPRAHWTAVRRAAHGNDVPPDLVLALMRQESAFQSTVCSSAGACGLMQLMPRTACWIGKHSDLGSRFCNKDLLSEPRASINAGSAYLAYLLELFSDDAVAAIAAYNAGPANVAQWLADSALRTDTARWVATLPFGETRRYIQAVLFNRVVYTQRGKAAPTALSLRLSDLLGALKQPPG